MSPTEIDSTTEMSALELSYEDREKLIQRAKETRNGFGDNLVEFPR